MSIQLSVIICTHNPNPAYLARVLKSLRDQTLPRNCWELILVDNASTPPISPSTMGMPNGRIIVEPNLGLTRARVAGFNAAQSDLFVMVDDDNILAPDYLEQTLSIGAKWPMLGTWGGQCIPEFESEPPAWTRAYWPSLAIRQFQRDRWSNVPFDIESMPVGAGMTVRRCVAQEFQRRLAGNPARFSLGRTGSELMGGEDTEICCSAAVMGLGNGIFTTLALTHIIPSRRLSESYLLRLTEGLYYSYTLLQYFNDQPMYKPPYVSRYR